MNVIFAKYDMDTGYVYAKLSDGNIVLIDCTAYERAHAENMHQCSDLDHLIYNDPIGYTELVMENTPRTDLRSIGNIHGLNTLS